MRKSFKSLRDPQACARGQRALAALPHHADQGKSALSYFEEAGCALEPTLPYAWQEPTSVIELPAMRYGRINGVGLMNRHNDLPPSLFEQSVHTGVGMACFEAFCHTLTTKTVVIGDNASIHSSEACADRRPSWKQHGLIIKYLSPYSPA